MAQKPPKEQIHINVEASNGLKALLLDSDITTTIAKAYDSVERVFLQVQRDLAEKLDDDTTLQILKGLAKLDNTLKLFKAEGEQDIRNESK